MISIIICSINPNLLSNLKRNIAETIGMPYEIIAIDNSINNWGICKVYNQGAEKATYPILCFAHEDISFVTNDWGRLVCAHFSDPKTGLLGLAGGDAKSLVPSSWSIPVVSNEINIFQHYRSVTEPSRHIVVRSPDTLGSKERVVSLDGVWLCTKKEIFCQFTFDERTFGGFHGYDIDYSLQVNTLYKVYVIFDLVVHHYSDGKPDRKWVESAILVSKKWKNKLPVSVYDLPWSAYNIHHWQSLQVFLHKLIQLNYEFPVILRHYLNFSFTRFFTFRQFFSMGKYVILQLISKKENSRPKREVKNFSGKTG
ncbi:glycosyltransferase [Flavitalea flava]